MKSGGTRWAVGLGCGLLSALFSGCGTGSSLSPRFVSANNALVGVGLTASGAIRQASLGKSKDARFRFESGAGCFSWLTVSDGALTKLEASVVTSEGENVVSAESVARETVLKACVSTQGTYQLRLRAVEGEGEVLAAMYRGAPGAPEAKSEEVEGVGTCASPKLLQPGVASGTTARGENQEQGSCGGTESSETVYSFTLATKQRVTIELDPRFDSILYMRRDACGEAEFEVACNDDAGPAVSHGGSNSVSRIDGVYEPGKYFVFVDGNNGQTGSYRLTAAISEVPTLGDACKRAKPISFVQPATGNLSTAFDHAQASCGEGAPGPDVPFSIEVPVAARVRIKEKSGDFSPVIHLRRHCDSEQDELGCSEKSVDAETATFVGSLAAGTYAVFADATEKDAAGRFELDAETDVEPGSGIVGDSCKDAATLLAADQNVEVDTFTARDDVAASCGGAGAPDAVYRFDLDKRMRFIARTLASETKPLLTLSRGCGNAKAELACGATVDQVLSPGSYFLTVDGARPGSFGKSRINVRVSDVARQESACNGAPLLKPGQTVSGTTKGAGDHFFVTCAPASQSNADREYKIVLAQRTKVRLELSTPTWEGVLALRRACLDLPGGVTAEMACNRRKGDAHHAQIDRVLDPGTYFVTVDGNGASAEGAFTLRFQSEAPK